MVNDDYNATTPPILEGIGSREGILKQLQSINNNGSHPALWLIPEFTGLLNKAKSKATATLTETMLQLADRPPEMSNYSLSEPIRVENPAVTILGDSTVENLTRTFSTTALTNGFLNRLSIFVGERGEPNPIPPRINETALRDVAADLKRSSQDKEVKLDEETESLWIAHYETEVYQTQQEPGGEVFARVGDRILQIAMVYALSNDRSIIEKDDLETAIKVVQYLTDCTRTVAQMVGQTDLSQLLDRLVEIVHSHPNGCTAGTVRRSLSTTQRTGADSYGGVAKLLRQLKDDGSIQDAGDGKFI